MGIYKRNGQEIIHCDAVDNGGHCEQVTHIADAGTPEMAHFLVIAANDYYDYMGAADTTNSPIWNPQNVDRDALLSMLRQVVEICDVLNLNKKLLVRGKSREDLHLASIKLHESLAVEFDPMNTDDKTINVVHGALGVITEAGEVAEMLIAIIEGQPIDDTNVIEESGDLRWYIARMLRGIGKTDRDCERVNISKLKGRHGETFNAARDWNRDLAAERKRLAADAGTPLFEERTKGEPVEFVDPYYNADTSNGGENVGEPKRIERATSGKPVPEIVDHAAAPQAALVRPQGIGVPDMKKVPPSGIRG